MPKVRRDITNLDRYSKGSRFVEKYPYLDSLLDGKAHELVQGTDFTTTTESMRQGLLTWAEKRGLDLSVRTEKGNVLVQLRKRPTSKPKSRRKR